jgi:hypothetical protein
MRTLIIPFVLAAAGPALAQPAPPPAPAPAAAPSTCSVTIVRAPDPVRQTIEQWLAKEHCTLALQVRIIPTEGGLYLLATDEHGRVRERIVPDAASAGVLIASWAADDGLGGAAPPVAAPPPPPPPAGYSQPAYTGPAPIAPPNYPRPAYAPGSGPVTAFGPGDFHPTTISDNDNGEPTRVVEPRHPEKYLTLAAGLGSNAGGTLRAEIDLYSKNGWTIGAALGITDSEMTAYDVYSQNGGEYDAHLTDYAFALAIGHLWRFGDWHLRGSVALGLVVSTMDLGTYDYNNDTYQTGSGSMTSPYVETSLMAGHSFGATKTWGIEAGPVLSYTKQEWYLSDTMSTMYREAGNVMFVVGLRHGL